MVAKFVQMHQNWIGKTPSQNVGKQHNNSVHDNQSTEKMLKEQQSRITGILGIDNQEATSQKIKIKND